MTLTEAKKELDKFVRLKTTMRPTFADVLMSDDVVEVVRCRECSYREKEQPGMVYCPNTVGGWVDEDWFCAGGERE